MPEARAEDMREPIPISTKPFIPTIPTDDEELLELGEDLRIMGYKGLLAQPWNVQADDVLREFKFERGNQWIGTKRQNLDNWTPDTWAKVYGFPRGIAEGWTVCRKIQRGGRTKGKPPPRCRNPRERRVLEFLMPILNPGKPKIITLTMANTLLGAMSEIRPVNWGVLIREVVARAIPHVGRKPSYLSSFTLYLYIHYECITMDEEDLLTIASKEVAYKLHPAVADTRTSNNPIIPEAPPSSPGSLPLSFRRPNSPTPPPPHHHPEAGPNRATLWRNVDLSGSHFPENPFKRIHDELDDLQTQFTDLSTSSGEPIKCWIIANPETSSGNWRKERTGRSSIR